MLSLPVYLRGNIYYLHTRINRKQVKRSLHTSDRMTAIITASRLLSDIKMASDFTNIKTYKIDLSRGTLESDGEDDHRRMLEALKLLKSAPQPPILGEPSVKGALATSGIRLSELVDKFFNLKKQLKPATVVAYKNVAQELAKFLKNPIIPNIGISDITRFQEFLSTKNVPRTVDNKMATLRTLFYFAIKQGYYFNENPAIGRTILSKTDKAKSGYAIFESEEISKIYRSEIFEKEKENDPDFYWVMILGLFTGCRISEVTSLKKDQFLVSERGVNFIRIRDSKTLAGIRDIPVTQKIFDLGFGKFIENKDKIFKYEIRLGKGSGNAVGKKFKRILQELKIDREKLVFHSLRKFVNDMLLKHNVHIEPRCQFLGHEIDNVNVVSYSKKFTVDELAELISSANQNIMSLSGLTRLKL